MTKRKKKLKPGRKRRPKLKPGELTVKQKIVNLLTNMKGLAMRPEEVAEALAHQDAFAIRTYLDRLARLGIVQRATPRKLVEHEKLVEGYTSYYIEPKRENT